MVYNVYYKVNCIHVHKNMCSSVPTSYFSVFRMENCIFHPLSVNLFAFKTSV